ncbi:dermonecrotic toxin domain-containing protein [Pseudomonas sp. S191]|uniref:dermonecrotic toxin domain-containing protein n=1 Tax=unclassified Pseudomonas TaxID=196821 RepID=UPI0021D812FC|nr:DUF6543 domain-containing protein [Pseudomonas sp. YeP6b]UXZ23844.1 hypothetical protein KZH41_06420 [Pseudomonas sp. YeP6b]
MLQSTQNSSRLITPHAHDDSNEIEAPLANNLHRLAPSPPVLTYAPGGIPLPTSPAIPPVKVQYPQLVSQFNVSNQEAFNYQHRNLTHDMQRLHSQQPKFQDFLNQQLAQMLAGRPNLKPEDLTFEQRTTLRDGSVKTLSSEPLLDALNRKVAARLASPDKKVEDDSAVRSDVFAPSTATYTRASVATKFSLDELAQRVVTQFAQALQAFWTTPRPTLRDPDVVESPQNHVLTLHKQQLSTLAALRVSDGTMSNASKRLIDVALQYPMLAEREQAFPNGARPGVYPLTIDDGTERGALMAGSFLITSTDGSHATPPTWTNGRTLPLDDANGPVVLYTPGEGLEEFATPAQARQAVAQRIDAGGASAELLLQTLPLSLQNRPEPPSGNDVTLSAEPLTGDVLAEGIPWMLKRQQEEVKVAFARLADDPKALQTVDDAADWSYLLSGDNAMAARDEKLADKLAPEWLKNLNPAQNELFDVLELSEANSRRALTPLLEKIPPLGVFSRDQMNKAIKTLYPSAQVDADKLMVQVQVRSNLHGGGSSSSNTVSVRNHEVSLTDLALKNPSEFPELQRGRFAQAVYKLPLIDIHGQPILGDDGKQVVLEDSQLRGVVNTVDVGGAYTQLLKKELATDAESGAAGELRKAWKANVSDSLDKEAFVSALNPDTYKAQATQDTSSKRGAQWLAAVLDYPDPANRPQVDGKNIVANTLVQRGLPVQGVMVIGNTTDPQLVLHTPDAPDGISIREVADMSALNALMDKKEWKLYTASRKTPVSKDDVVKAGRAVKEYALDVTKSPGRTVGALVNILKLTKDPITLTPINGNFQDELYKQKVALVIDQADHQSVSSAEVAAQSKTNKALFGVEVALIFMDLLPVIGKGVSMGVRLGKAGVTALRAGTRILPRLIKNPGVARALYSDFSVTASGIPTLRAAPLRPVFKNPVVLQPSTGIVPTPKTTAGPQLDLSAVAVSDDVIKGRPLRPDGTYNVGDNWYVRFTDKTMVERVYQIDSAFHARDQRVAIVDPSLPLTTPKIYRIQAFLQGAGNGQWRSSQLPGGAPNPTVTSQGTKRAAGQGSSSGSSGSSSAANGQPAFKRPNVPESFPGEKALMEPPVKGKNIFYHYTSRKAHDTINVDYMLSSSGKDFRGVDLPRGRGRHYFTDLAPGDMPTKQISQTIFGQRKHGNALDKMSHYYEINTSGLNVIQTPDNPHIFYVDVPHSIPLKYRGGPDRDPVSRIISSGLTRLKI